MKKIKRESIFKFKHEIYSDKKYELENFCNKFVIKHFKHLLNGNQKPDFHMYDAVYFRSIVNDDFISLRLTDDQKGVQGLSINKIELINNGKVLKEE